MFHKLVRKMLVLAVLTTGLMFASFGNNARANISCDQCLINFDNCLLFCDDNQACIDGCNATLLHCYRFCD